MDSESSPYEGENAELMVSSQSYYLWLLLFFVMFIICIRNLFSGEHPDFLPSLIFMLVLLPFTIFHLKFVDIYLIDKSKIKLVRFENDLPVLRIESVKRFIITPTRWYSLCHIKWIDKNNCSRTAFFYVSWKKESYIDLLKDLVAKSNP